MGRHNQNDDSERLVAIGYIGAFVMFVVVLLWS